MGPEFLGYVWGTRGAVPAQVTGLVVTVASGTSLTLTWSALATAPDSYRVERSADGVSGWAEVGSTAGGVVTFTNSGLTAFTTYYYRVKGRNSRGDGTPSAVQSGTPSVPLSLSPVLWVEAGISTVFQDSARTTPAAADTDPVGSWSDLSGNSNHAFQTTAGKRPLLKLAIKNGRPVLRYDGTDDFLKCTSNAGLNPTLITIALVLQVSALANTPLFIAKASSYNFYAGATGTLVADLPNSLVGSAGLVANGNWYTLMFICDGANMFIYKNGAQVATRASVLTLASSANDLGVGARGDGIEPSGIDLGAAVIIGRAINSTERAALEADLNGRWAVY